MIKLNKVSMLIAAAVVAGSALASGSTTNSDNWRSGHGNVQWKIGNASGLCWRTANWTPATAAPGCDGAVAMKVSAPAPTAAAAPVMAAKPAPAPVMAAKPAPVIAAKPAPVMAAKPAPVMAAKPAPAPMAAKPAAAPAPKAKRKAKQDRN